MRVVRLKFVKKFIKLIKITNCVCVCVCVCGRIGNGYDVAVVTATSQPLRTCTAKHTQFVILIDFMNFLTNFNLVICTFQYIHK